MRTRSHSPAPSGPGLSQIAFETPSRPRSCTSPARRSVRTSPSPSPTCAAASAASSATARACPSVYGDFRSTKFAIATQRRVEALAGEHDRQRRLGVDHGVPGADGVEAGEHHLGVGAQQVGQRGVELLAAALAGQLPGRVDPAHPVRHLDVLRQHAPGGTRSGPRRRRARRASPCRPTSRRRRRARRPPRPGARAARPATARWRHGARSCRRRRGGPRARTPDRAGSGAAAGCPAPSSACPT